MKRNPVLLRSLAFLMMLVFTQKAGAGLFLHNAFHTAGAKTSLPDKDDRQVNFSCSCGDDFLIPFLSTEEIAYALPLVAHIVYPERTTLSSITVRIVTTGLRGPPVFASSLV